MARFAEDESLMFSISEEYQKKPGYIPIGAAVTSYARNEIITSAQSLYHGPYRPGFIYSDTDSIHVDLPEEEVTRNLRLHDTDFCAWKIENRWDIGWFIRPKTYLEVSDEERIVKCAGMPETCKALFLESVYRDHKAIPDYGILSDEHADFFSVKRELMDFKPGLQIPGKLYPKHIPGGVLLEEGNYTMI